MDNENVELHDEQVEVVDEAQVMPVGTEQQSIAATDKAAGSTSQAPARKGDKRNGEKMQKAPVTPEKPMESVDYREKLNDIMESEATLSDGFKAQVATIVEGTLKARLSEEIDRLETQYENQLEEEVSSIHEEVVSKLDSYLNYVVETWMKENEVAIAQGLRSEICEDFMSGMKDLFEASYIEVPESKVDLVDGLAEEVESLESKLNEQTEVMFEMASTLEQYQREFIINEASDGLADTQVEQLRKLTEDLDFEDTETFEAKVSSVKESFFNSTPEADETLNEETDEEPEVDHSSSMAQYLTAIAKTNR